MKSLSAAQRRAGKSLVLCLLLVLAMLLLSACNGNPQVQQQASQNRQILDASLARAQSIGVPANLLQPIIQQEHQLAGTHAPFSLFGDQSVNDYNSNLALRYSQLYSQVLGLETQSTQQLDYQAAQDLQTLSNVLAERQGQNFVETTTFAHQLTTYQQDLAKAQYPKEYIQISANAKNAIQALHLMGPAYNALTSLQKIIEQLQSSNIDVTALNQEYQSDLQSFRSATQPENFSQLIDLVNTQLNETATISAAAIPYVGQAKLNQFGTDIQLIKQYNGSDVNTYEQKLQADQQALNTARSVSDFLRVSGQIDADMASIQLPLTRAQATYLLQNFHQEVLAWGQAHQYHDPQNGQNYPLDYEYAAQGIGSDADAAVHSARTLDAYQSAIDLINNDSLHLRMMEQDASDSTAFNQPHTTDFTLMNHYGIAGAKEVLVVSLVEETLRYYQNGKLVRAFHITSGQFDKPSPPGYWQVFQRQSPTIFKSSEPKGSAFWYPDTNINFAMEFRSDGFFFHDSWWRADYGVGTNFPHHDSGGDESFAGSGSHGCINLAESDMAWLYPNTHYNAQVLLY